MESKNFIQNIIDEDLNAGKHSTGIKTRFPPEPNGYLHVGHAKSICLNFGLAQKYGGTCNLRFDDTNPTREEVEFVDSIQENIKWLGFDWEDRIFFASDYFEQLYQFAVKLIQKNLAYVDDLSADEIRQYRGTLTEPGKESPFRNRSIEENLKLFEEMRNDKYKDGEKVLRAKIDMSAGNMNMRDPVIYRIAHVNHHRTGTTWCIYPMYDFAHPLSDAIEGITHSICTLEFEAHRPFYDWLLDVLDFDPNTRPRQIEFARLELTNMVTSKRKLRQLVEENYVRGWDDPRMPTISGLKRRGYPPAAIRDFCERIGVAKSNSVVDISMLEHCVRENLNVNAERVMAVLNPLKVVLTNVDHSEMLLADRLPNSSRGKRFIPFEREIYIERDDFMEDAPKKFFRLKPGGDVRLINAYIIHCDEVIKDSDGNVIELHCSIDPTSKSGGATANRKIKGTIHWVAASTAIHAEVRLYDYLLTTDEKGNLPDDFLTALNPDSLKIIPDALIEPSVQYSAEGTSYQFLRNGYFVVDYDSTVEKMVFNKIIGLRDSWEKIKKG